MMPTPKSHRFHSILCVVDPSDRSETALRYARALAASSGGNVVESDVSALTRTTPRPRADVVVVGAKTGRDAISTAASVLRRFGRPVLVIPPRCRAPRRVWPGPAIVVAVGDDEHRHAEIAAAARMAEHFGAWLSVLSNSERSSRHGRPSLIIYPLPCADVRRLRKGSPADRFIGESAAPVLIIRTPRSKRLGAGGPARPPASRAA